MKNLKISAMIFAALAMIFSSCSKEEVKQQDLAQGPETTILSFDFSLKKTEESNKNVSFTKDAVTNLPSAEVPLCEEDQVPAYVRVALWDVAKNEYVDDGVAPANSIDIPIVDPEASVDSDGDDETNFLTLEHPDLELGEGNYRIDYFAVFNDGDDLIWMAPSSNETYGPANFDNYVERPLPIQFELKKGTKHYEELEVLCYDDDLAPEYGYLFFDFDMLPLTYLCIFGNECDETGRHTSSNFHVMVWDDSIPEDERNVDNALYSGENQTGTYDNGEDYALQLCIPLPDRPGSNLFYFEIYTIEDGDLSSDPIRSGYWEDEYIKENYFEDNGDIKEYWHFREGGEFCGEDSDPCLIRDANGNCENETYTCNDEHLIQDYPEYGVANLFVGDATLVTEYGNMDTDADGHIDQGISPFGKFFVTDDPSNFLPEFTISYMGKMILFDGLDDTDDVMVYTITTPELCEGDTFYLTMDLYDAGYHKRNESPTKLRISASGSPFQSQEFYIKDLTSNGKTENEDHWKTVGVTLVSTGGAITVEIESLEDFGPGHDFLMDNIILSPDPSILNVPDINLY